jgi:energy-coupling factor transporter ATP-binding protein EcfA2
MHDSAESVISIRNLSRRFGSKAALNEVSLEVSRGCVFGLVGENGAGKSTLIKHLLGLWRAETGTVRVFGTDPVADPVSVRSRHGAKGPPPLGSQAHDLRAAVEEHSAGYADPVSFYVEKLVEGVTHVAVSGDGEKLLYHKDGGWFLVASGQPPKPGERGRQMPTPSSLPQDVS